MTRFQTSANAKRIIIITHLLVKVTQYAGSQSVPYGRRLNVAHKCQNCALYACLNDKNILWTRLVRHKILVVHPCHIRSRNRPKTDLFFRPRQVCAGGGLLSFTLSWIISQREWHFRPIKSWRQFYKTEIFESLQKTQKVLNSLTVCYFRSSKHNNWI